MKEILFFDLDGTLTDSMLGITRAVQYALKHYGIMVEDLKELQPFVGPPLHESFQEYFHFSEKDSHEAVFVFREYYNAKGWMENRPYDGIEEMLKMLRDAGKTLIVATSKPESMAKQVLTHFHLADYFQFIGGASSDSLRVNKDDVIRYVMESCKLTEADRPSIVRVGGRRHEFLGAHNAGLEAVGVRYGYGSREELSLAGADWIAGTVKELGALLTEI